MATFSAIVQDVIRLAVAVTEEEKSISKRLGINPGDGIDVGSQQSMDLMFSARPAEGKLNNYLESLSKEELLKLQTIMYFGRGDSEDIHSLHRQISEPYDKDIVIGTIVSKTMALADYLQQGMKSARNKGVNLEGRF